jgi:hypothetical protein
MRNSSGAFARLSAAVRGGVVCACAVVAMSAQDASAQDAPASREAASRPAESRPTEAPFARRIGGDTQATAERVDRGAEVEWRAGKSRITTALPEGYPDPTPPGAIDLKRYPVVRRAEVAREDGYDRGSNGAFWPLFRHISKHGISMTSPVEVDYAPAPTAATSGDRWTMSFLYRKPDMGKTGPDGPVVVADRPGLLYVSIGVRGSYSQRTVEAAAAELRKFLQGRPEWVEDGPPRALYYNGPEMRNADKWAEVQLPVRAAPAR